MEKVVCVTGGGGFIGSWLIKHLISHGYHVHATLRNPDDPKNAHLKQLENAAEKLQLFKADLLDYDSILAAIKGCQGVFHVACPVPSGSVPNPEVELVKPALEGTLNVLKASSEAQVTRVVYVSSVAAVCANPDWPKDRIMDETCWSDAEYCRTNNYWYFYSKTVAEAEALEYGKRNGLDVVSQCPTLVIGPMLQNTANTSSLALVKLLEREGYEALENNTWNMVDVRDVAEALKLLYEKQEAEGRYICSSHGLMVGELVEILREMYPSYKYPKSYKEGTDMSRVSSEKLEKLGWKYRGFKESLVDSVESYKQDGLLDS